MPTPDELLPRDQIRKLCNEYDRTDLNAMLATTLTGMYAATADYVKAIGEAFYDTMTTPPPGDVITPSNRERCLIALLASRGAGFALAVHIYIALMEGFCDAPEDELTPNEIASIIFLTGIYTGSDNMMRSLVTMTTTLKVLKEVADAEYPGITGMGEGDVLAALKKKYAGTLL